MFYDFIKVELCWFTFEIIIAEEINGHFYVYLADTILNHSVLYSFVKNFSGNIIQMIKNVKLWIA